MLRFTGYIALVLMPGVAVGLLVTAVTGSTVAGVVVSAVATLTFMVWTALQE